MARDCLFCANPVSSREHVWPQWLLELIGSRGAMEITATRGPQEDSRTWIGEIMVRAVCDKCNSGWMSTLESQAKPLLTRLILGERTSLNVMEVGLLAAWTAKTAMMFDCARANQARFFERHECEYVKRGRLPPPSTTVWIGGLRERVHPYAKGRQLVLDPDESKGIYTRVEAMASTLVVGSLILQGLFAGQLADVGKFRFGDPEHDQLLVPIWPHADSSVLWPPPQLVEADTEESCTQALDDLAERFTRRGAEKVRVPFEAAARRASTQS